MIGSFALFVTLITSFTVAADALSLTQIVTPDDAQTTQIVAGLPMGCQITAMLYALKFGPASWRASYEATTGQNDATKIKLLAAKFNSLPSRGDADRPAFSPVYGTDPNDLGWMFKSLVPSGPTPNLKNLLRLPRTTGKRRLLSNFRETVSTHLSVGQPVIANLLYSGPDFAHAVLITAVRSQPDQPNELQIRVLDPMTGRTSWADVSFGKVLVQGREVFGLSFIDPEIVSRAGILLSVLDPN